MLLTQKYLRKYKNYVYKYLIVILLNSQYMEDI